jgi:hypothetical protein
VFAAERAGDPVECEEEVSGNGIEKLRKVLLQISETGLISTAKQANLFTIAN